jgi:hypothetical protein
MRVSGRDTVSASHLRFNLPKRVEVRETLSQGGHYPSED